jgi:hypothetical protein
MSHGIALGTCILTVVALAAGPAHAQQDEQQKAAPSQDRPMMHDNGMMNMMHRMDEMMNRCNEMMKSASPKDAPEKKG